MTHWFNFLLRIVTCYGIFIGFIAIYIDIPRRIVKSHIILKVYVLIENVFYIVFAIWYFITSTQLQLLNFENLVESFAVLAVSFFRLLFFLLIIYLRIKGDQILEKWLKIMLLLQTNYFDKLLHFGANERNTKMLLIFKIIILIANTLVSLLTIIKPLEYRAWMYFSYVILASYVYGMQQYIMLHHGLILSYLNYCFSKLNNQLQYGRVKKPFAKVYFQLLTLVQEVNKFYGPIIFVMLLYVLLMNSTSIYYVFIYLKDDIYKTVLFEFILIQSAFTFLCLDVYLYFLICERLCDTHKETKRIILEYSTTRKENLEV
ncbi:hypothetical protein CVS40_10679 [Lucilia cuprina]|nr:hypothetical protein CVS40_10679 [Lucilia cuprina]